MKKILYVYKIINKINGKKYIGKHSSINLKNNYYGSGIAIKKAINKYGKHSFIKEIICICESELELNRMEILLIDLEKTFKNGYNMTKGGEGMLGYIFSKESIEKAQKKRKKFYEDNSEIRKILSDKAKLRIGDKNSFYGKKLSKEHIDKMTKARIKAITGHKNPSAVKLLCIELNKIFNTAKDAAIFCNLAYSTTILKCAKGKIKKAGGYTWRIIENE